MKKTYLIILIFTLSGWFISCDESFLDKNAVGSFSEITLGNAAGVIKSLNGAYSQLNGGGIGMWTANLFNDVTGSIQGGEYYKGSSKLDYIAISDLQGWKLLPSNAVANGNFNYGYTGIDRCNIVLQLCNIATDLIEAEKNRYKAEARFLRGMYYFHLKKNFYNIPWVDENTEDARIPNYTGEPSDKNYVDIWPEIIADFEFAAQNLPETQSDLARPNKWAAQCFLAKVLLFSATYDPENYSANLTTALTLINDAINNGVSSKGESYALLENYHDNFNAAYEHNSEYVWGIELSTLDGDADGFFQSPNSNQGAQFWGYWKDPNGPSSAMGWGFQQPTEWWANHFRTDARGLPYLDMFEGTRSSSDTLKDDYGIDPAPAPFEIETQPVDPRLDWSIGRRGIPFLEYGEFPGESWIREQRDGGPYGNKKFQVLKSQVGVYQSLSNCYPAINLPLMRYSDVLLMAAELEVRTNGSFSRARELVNEVRNRMTTNTESPRHWVKKNDGVTNAANYVIGTYDPSYPDDPFNNSEDALDAILFERTLELGGKGHRFYDVVRFGKGTQEFTAYRNFTISLKDPEGELRYGFITSEWIYEEPKDKFMPMPTTAIDRSKVNGIPTLIQNPGY